jgi:hypothetical protein
MFWQRIESQVSCDCIVLTDLGRIWCLQIAVMSKIATDPMQGILFARAGLDTFGSNDISKFGGPFERISELIVQIEQVCVEMVA